MQSESEGEKRRRRIHLIQLRRKIRKMMSLMRTLFLEELKNLLLYVKIVSLLEELTILFKNIRNSGKNHRLIHKKWLESYLQKIIMAQLNIN